MAIPALRGSATALLQRAVGHPAMRAASAFAAVTAVAKAVAFVKEAVVAAAFGVGSSMDSYLMALVVVAFPSGVLLNAAQTVFIRDYVRILEVQGERAAGRFLRIALAGLLLSLTGLLLAWLAFLPAVLSVVGHGLAAPQRALVTDNVWRLIPYYYLNGLNLLGYGVLQARKSFVRSALIPIATPLVVMAVVGLLGADLRVLIGALTLGTGVETVVVAILVARAHARASGPAPSLRHETRELSWGTLVLVPGTLVTGLAPVIEQTIASGLGHGTISALGYASKLPATLNSLLTTAVGVTSLPYFAQRLAREDLASCRRFFLRYACAIGLAGAAVAAAAVLGSEPFVRIAFQRGHFSLADAETVTALQRAYLWQLPGAMVAMVATRFLAAEGRYRAITLGSFVMVPLTGLLQWGFSLHWGAVGLAFGMSSGMAVSAVGYFLLALHGEPRPDRRQASA
jgi:putative peptidoglycan lipid II flippase